jgi:hypothetical protein
MMEMDERVRETSFLSFSLSPWVNRWNRLTGFPETSEEG